MIAALLSLATMINYADRASLAVQRELRTVLEGKPDVGLTAGLGYEHQFAETGNGIFVEAGWYHGLGDVVKTQSNGYGFIDTDNRVQSAQITIGLLFSLN